MTIPSRVIVALDVPSADAALELAARLTGGRCRMKVGKELFTSGGPSLVERLMRQGFEVFLDLKYHDIPNTVASACRSAAALGVWMVDVHALGGRAMMTAAREAVASFAVRPKVIAVTVLTSMTSPDLVDIGLAGTPAEAVRRLALLARDCGMDGVVSSPREAADLRSACGAEFLLVTPGVRPAGTATDDQARVMTPAQAIAAGASYLVIGRPITQAGDPLAALEAINAQIAGQAGAG